MPQDEFSLSGYELVSRTVKPHGNGARVGVPKDWIGEEAAIIRRTKQDEDATIGPTAALMYDSIVEDGNSLPEAMSKVVRFQSFRDINTEIATVFKECLEGTQTPRNILSQESRSTENVVLSRFYEELSDAPSQKAVEDVLENWI